MFHHNNLRKPHRICLRSIDRVLTLFLFVVLLIPVGCSKEEIKEKLKEAQQKVESVAESTVKAVEDKLPPTGSIALEMSNPVEELKRADFELIVIGDGRPERCADSDATIQRAALGSTPACCCTGRPVQRVRPACRAKRSLATCTSNHHPQAPS